MKINLINLIILISKQIQMLKFPKLEFRPSLGQLGIRSIRIFYIFLVSCIMIPASTPSAWAQSLPKGITVIPSIMYIDLAVDPPEYELKYINNTNSLLNLELSAQDFTELEESYKITFLEGRDAKNYKYSLSSWISFENKNLELAPKEEKSVKIYIDKDRITRGGHYASIFAKVIQPKNEKQININPVLSSLLFVRASTGREVESGKINTLRPDRNGLDFPKNVILRFQNDGNVYVIPYGQVQIKNASGKVVSKGFLNEGSLNSLPESIRRFDIKLKNDTYFMLPGFYTAEINMHFGKENRELNYSTKFFSQGSFNFLKIGLLLLTIILIIYYIRKRRKSK